MNKIKIVLASILFIFPVVSFADTTPVNHFTYQNDNPSVITPVGSNTLNLPFNVSCQLLGGTGNKLVWSGIQLNRNNSAQGVIADPGYTVPTIGSTTVSWVGVDMSSTTPNANNIVVKYKTSGFKFMYFSVTDGITTEVSYCGGEDVNVDPPVTHKLIEKNGIEIDY